MSHTDWWEEMEMKRLFGFLPILAVNLIPLYGALMLGWNAWQIIFIYWAESVIFAFFGLLKFGVCGFSPLSSITFRVFFENVFIMLLFAVFFMGFLFIIGGILNANMYMLSSFESSYNPFWPDPVPFGLASFLNSPLLGLTACFCGQIYFFIRDFLIPGEYRKSDMIPYLTGPLKRIVIMHLSALAGGWFIVSRFSADPPNFIFLAWIGLKLALDLLTYFGSIGEKSAHQ